VPVELLSLLKGKDVQVGVIDVATGHIETPEEVAETIGTVMKYVPKERIIPSTNCGMAPMRRGIALAKLSALCHGAKLAQERYA
jgi:5-methyltetrahydropteroyltriglutamate--homocysteine methyltransferase